MISADRNHVAVDSVLATLVDLESYPIDDLDSDRGRALVANCRAELGKTDSCLLPGFVRAEAIAQMRADAREVAPLAYFGGGRRVNAYYDDGESSLRPHHPKNVFFDLRVGIVAYDQVPKSSALRRFYERDELTEFIAAAIGVSKLYRENDPYQPLSIMVLNDGHGMGWHFDASDFTVTMMLQAPESGGEFEFMHNIRTADDPCYGAIQRMYQGDRTGMRTVSPEPGAIFIFQGRNSLHHVLPIRGPLQRLMAVLTYDTTPEATISEAINIATYGPRVASSARGA